MFYAYETNWESILESLKRDHDCITDITFDGLNKRQLCNFYSFLSPMMSKLTFKHCTLDLNVLQDALKDKIVLDVTFKECTNTIDEIAEFMCENKTIESFDLRKYRIEPEEVPKLEMILQRNKTLESFYVNSNDLWFSDNIWKYLYNYPKIFEPNMYLSYCHKFEELLSDWFEMSDNHVKKHIPVSWMRIHTVFNIIIREQPCYVQTLFLLNYHDNKEIEKNQNPIFVDLFSSEYFDVHLLFIVFEFAMRLKRT